MMLHSLGLRESVAMMASEENERPLLAHGGSPRARYIVVFDPLDGSSNIDVGGTVGTTFSILRRTNENLEHAVEADEVLQCGAKQVAAGYVMYGSSTMLVYSAGYGVHGFTLDPAVGAYVLSHPNIRMPAQGKYYSMNEAHLDFCPPTYQRYMAQLRRGELGQRYASRYVGAMVADIHRTLLKGGVFLYPPSDEYPQGKLRLLYEANPIAFLVEQAGGVASDGQGRVMDVQPTAIHQRTPLVVGGTAEMAAFAKALRG
jgi:fructose-1,6-bisphosphatase I